MQVRLNISGKSTIWIFLYVGVIVWLPLALKSLPYGLATIRSTYVLEKTLNHPICLKIQHYQLMCGKKVTGNNKIAIQRKVNAP